MPRRREKEVGDFLPRLEMRKTHGEREEQARWASYSIWEGDWTDDPPFKEPFAQIVVLLAAVAAARPIVQIHPSAHAFVAYVVMLTCYKLASVVYICFCFYEICFTVTYNKLLRSFLIYGS
jgi:hypothetical protein